MPFITQKELLNLELNTLNSEQLREFANQQGLFSRKSNLELIKDLIEKVSSSEASAFIKNKYQELVNNRKKMISDDELKKELFKVKSINWGVVQGQLDGKIQKEYVRRFTRYDDLLKGVKSKLYMDLDGYVIASWFNHWTTVLIEKHIGQHSRVVPTLKKKKGIDIFFDGQPFDLKITYIKNYNLKDAIAHPKDLITWMYENQGRERFGAHNRIYIVLADKDNPQDSWKLKRESDFLFKEIGEFFDKEKVSKKDELVFSFNHQTFTTVAKILILIK